MPETAYSSVHKKPIAERLAWLNELSVTHSRLFRSPDAYLNRVRYLASHPTRIIAFKCMDGRIHLPFITKTPLGIIHPFRNLGGAFDMGWPYLGEIVSATVMRAVREGRRVLVLVTYHFSRGLRERGCAGFGFDTGLAHESAMVFMRQMESVFGRGRQTVYPMVVGVETDEDAMILHGMGQGQTVEMSAWADRAGEPDLASSLRHALGDAYPCMPDGMIEDLMPLALGNIAHIAEVRQTERALDIDHHEWILCVGRGFDFLHAPNTALIVGPYSHDMGASIVSAASVIQSNMEAGRIPDDGMLLLASSPYDEVGVDYRRAVEKARFLCRFSASAIAEHMPYIHERMLTRTCVLNWATRELEDVE